MNRQWDTHDASMGHISTPSPATAMHGHECQRVQRHLPARRPRCAQTQGGTDGMGAGACVTLLRCHHFTLSSSARPCVCVHVCTRVCVGVGVLACVRLMFRPTSLLAVRAVRVIAFKEPFSDLRKVHCTGHVDPRTGSRFGSQPSIWSNGRLH